MLKIILTATFILLQAVGISLGFSGGDGTALNPYQISSSDDMATLISTPSSWNKHFIVTSDINLTNFAFTPIGGNGFANFTGVFDGGNHTITGFKITGSSVNYAGFFGVIGTAGEVKSLNLSSAAVSVSHSSSIYAGVIAGWNMGSITDSTITGALGASSASDAYAGAIAGYNTGYISGCGANANLWATFCIGGIAGYNAGYIEDCYFAGNVIADEAYVGGIAGYCEAGSTIIRCSVSGSVTVNADAPLSHTIAFAGGITAIAEEGVLIELCSVAAEVSAEVSGKPGIAYAGGIVASADSGANISRSFSQAEVLAKATAAEFSNSSAYAGGVIGFNYGNANNCYATGSTTAQALGGSSNAAEAGGFVGRQSGGSIARNYSSAIVSSTTSTRRGAFAGAITAGEITSSFWDYQTSEFDPANHDGIGRKTGGSYELFEASIAQMQTQSTFTAQGWNFVQIWQMSQQTGYPEIIGVMMPVVFEPDLIILSSIAGTTSAAQGATVAVDVVIKNVGSVSTGSYFYTAIYISDNSGIDWNLIDGEEFADIAYCSALSADGSVEKRLEVVMPQEEGTYYLRTKADIYDSIAESNENNNWSEIIVVTVEVLPYAAGSGTFEDPYIITTAAHLEILGSRPQDWNKDFVLGDNIDMTGAAFTPIGSGASTGFSGTFNGNGHIISNITINDDQTDYHGVFGFIMQGGQVLNLGIENIQINAPAAYYVGSIAGWSNGVIDGCYSTGAVLGEFFVGGISGGISGEGAKISNSYSLADVVAISSPAGLVCYALVPAQITNSYFAGTIESGDYFGGAVTFLFGATVENTFFDIDKLQSMWSAGGAGVYTDWLSSSENLIAAGWDYQSVWKQLEGSYPILKWQTFEADFNGDDIVDFDDLLIFLSQWLMQGEGLQADINGNGVVDLSDYAIFADKYMVEPTP